MRGSSVDAKYSLVLGSDIIPESDLPDSLPLPEGQEGIDGALVLRVGDDTLLDERYWDRLDECLLSLLEGVQSAKNGHESTIIFPDTRLEIEIFPLSQNNARLMIEHREFEVPLHPIEEALIQCARRLLARLPTEVWSDSTHSLERITQDKKEYGHA